MQITISGKQAIYTFVKYFVKEIDQYTDVHCTVNLSNFKAIKWKLMKSLKLLNYG